MKKATISPEEGAELEAATIRNIIEKVASGGIPTARELDMLKGATAEPAPTTNLRNATNAALAKHYKVSLSTVKSWLRRYGSACVRDGAKLQAALDGQRSAKEITHGTPLAAARLAKVLLESDKLRFQNECARGEWHLAADVVTLVTEWSGYFRAELEALAHAHAPLWGGLTPPQIESAAVQWVEGVMTRLAEIADRRLSAMSRPTK